jgi:hypothetical protein
LAEVNVIGVFRNGGGFLNLKKMNSAIGFSVKTKLLCDFVSEIFTKVCYKRVKIIRK